MVENLFDLDAIADAAALDSDSEPAANGGGAEAERGVAPPSAEAPEAKAKRFDGVVKSEVVAPGENPAPRGSERAGVPRNGERRDSLTTSDVPDEQATPHRTQNGHGAGGVANGNGAEDPAVVAC